MAPDLNSLPPLTISITATLQTMASTTNEQRIANIREGSPSPSPRSRSRSASVSLQAAATLNAGLQRGDSLSRPANVSLPRQQHGSPSSDRRRSQVLMNLQMADPNVPPPGEMITENHNHNTSSGLSVTASPRRVSASPQPIYPGEPQHFRARAPSLGELHQELENEQELQVNRLLAEIRRLQQQVQRQQSSAVSDESTPDRSTPLPISAPPSAHPTTASGSVPRSPVFPHHPRSSFDMARADLQRVSRTPSQGASPRLRSTSISAESGEQWVLGSRDESAFYQAETQMLTRENQMLRHRIRDLERQLSESSLGSTHESPHSSHLNRSTSVSEELPRAIPSHLETVADVPKED